MAKKSVKKAKKTQKPQIPRSIFNNVFFYIFMAVVIYTLMGMFQADKTKGEVVPISQAISLIKEEKVQNVKVSGDQIEILLKDGTALSAEKEASVSFDEILTNNNVDRSKIAGELKIEKGTDWLSILSPIISIAFPLLLLFFIFRQMRGSGGEIMSFAQSRAKLFNKEDSKITFKDVAGAEEAKRELYEIVDFLKHPEKYRKLGARIPKGILLVGSSGVGKTLLAKAIAGEAGVPFFSVAGSEFMEMLVGVGSARARDLFQKAKATQPSLIFIDEIDAIGRQRGMGIGGGHDEREQTLNQILTEMDGFDPRTAVIVIGATNREDMLDSALVRPGRFDRKVTIPMPDLKDRGEIIKVHMQGKPIAKDVSIEKLAKRTVGFSGADLENMLNEGAILAARENRTEITEADLEEASLKVTMGSERKTLQTDEERKMVAYHEAGHALVSSKMPEMDPVHQISIVARGGSLGHTSLPPERDRYNETKTRLFSMIATMLGGRAAEEIVFNEQTIGASDDIKRATAIARKMVTEFGMSELGPINYDGHQEYGWIAREISSGSDHSEEVSAKVDQEIRKIMDGAYSRAKAVLSEYRAVLDRVASALLDHETIRNEEYEKLLLA